MSQKVHLSNPSPRQDPVSSAARRLAFAASLSALLVANAYASPQKATAFYDEAVKLVEKKDNVSAVLQLKNALQLDPKMLSAHLLLGKVLLSSGQTKAAEAALETALKLGVHLSEVAVPLAQVYLRLDESRKLLETISPAGLPPKLQADVLTLRGSAHARLGDSVAALDSFSQARKIDPQSPTPLIAEVPFLLRAGDRDKAKAHAVQATQLAPSDYNAWFTLGTVLQHNQDLPGALAAYDKALQFSDKHVDSHVNRAAVLIMLKREAEAEQVLLKLKRDGVQEPRASFMRGNLAATRGDAQAAKAEYAVATGLIDSMPPGMRSSSEPLLMAGALSHRALGNLGKAREYLETLLARNSRHVGGSMLLASVLLDLRDYQKAVPLLEQLLRALPQDAQVMQMLGTAQMGRGQYAQAAELFERASGKGSNTEALRELGISQLSLGQEKLGLASLEQAFAKNPKDARAGIQLAMAYQRLSQSSKAVAVATQVASHDPDSAEMLNFLGNVKARAGDKAGARAAWDRTLVRAAGNRVASINLNWLDIEEGKLESARARLTRMLATQANDPDALLQMGSVEHASKRYQEAINWWQKADGMQRQDPRAGLAMVDLLLNQRAFDVGLKAAKRVAANYPSLFAAQMALARAQLASGDTAAARQTLTAVTRTASYDAGQQVAIGRLQLAAGNLDGASHNALKALQSSADDLGALMLQVEVEAARKNTAGVDTALKALTSRHPQAVPTLVTTGHVAMSRGRFGQAQVAYRQALERAPSPGMVLLLAQAHLAAKETDKASAVLQDWLRKHPTDPPVMKALAEVFQRLGKQDAARDLLKRVVAADPTDIDATLTLAALQQRMRDPRRARHSRKRAVPIAGQCLRHELVGSDLDRPGPDRCRPSPASRRATSRSRQRVAALPSGPGLDGRRANR
jgi:putative PEP-CTERM system TPR-repeat lipoprotein